MTVRQANKKIHRVFGRDTVIHIEKDDDKTYSFCTDTYSVPNFPTVQKAYDAACVYLQLGW